MTAGQSRETGKSGTGAPTPVDTGNLKNPAGLQLTLWILLALVLSFLDFLFQRNRLRESDVRTLSIEKLIVASQKGDLDAERELGRRYMSGVNIKTNEAEGAKWLRRAAEKGDARSQVILGHLYAQGKGVNQDDLEALKWTRMAAQNGDPLG
jgi:Sel1 repeat